MKEGDKVLLKQPPLDNLSTRSDPQPYTVLARKGLSVVLQRGTDARNLRNVSRVRKLYEDVGNSCDDNLFPVARAPAETVNQPATRAEHGCDVLQVI